ncbi:MAG: urease accessory protein UreD [Pseudomonadota bacterium]
MGAQTILDQSAIDDKATALPRAVGDGLIKVRRKGDTSVLSDLRMSGCLKVLFSRGSPRVDAILINSAGGLTSGDQLSVKIGLEEGAAVSATTQAAERAYRAVEGKAHMHTRLEVAQGAQMLWLPQELILFDGAKLDRQLHCYLDADARLVLVEPVIFGRAQMGEALQDVWFRDRIAINREGAPLYRDTTQLSGNIDQALSEAAIAQGAGAMASLVYAAPDAAAHHRALIETLPQMAGASLLHEDVLVLRLLARDGFELRRSLLPILDRLTGHTLPISWRL